jgi:hypothetical protein
MISSAKKNAYQKTEIENPFFQPTLTDLKKIIGESTSRDPSMHSLAYILMTARKGLYAFAGQHTMVLFSRHPNLENTYIIFPPNSDAQLADVLTLATILKARNYKVELIRVTEDQIAPHFKDLGREAITEEVLDYKFPVHIIKTENLLALKGRKLLKFRNKINAIHKEPVEIFPADFSKSGISLMKEITKEWSLIVFKEDQMEHASYIFYVLDNLVRIPDLQGLIAFYNGIPSGFTLWENPHSNYNTATSLIHCNMHKRGLSELLHYEMARKLHKKGVEYVSLGGAENKGLDDFKRKMNPCMSLPLKTMQL